MGDSGLDNQKMFASVGKQGQKFTFQVSHLESIVEVYNNRIDCW